MDESVESLSELNLTELDELRLANQGKLRDLNALGAGLNPQSVFMLQLRAIMEAMPQDWQDAVNMAFETTISEQLDSILQEVRRAKIMEGVSSMPPSKLLGG